MENQTLTKNRRPVDRCDSSNTARRFTLHYFQQNTDTISQNTHLTKHNFTTLTRFAGDPISSWSMHLPLRCNKYGARRKCNLDFRDAARPNVVGVSCLRHSSRKRKRIRCFSETYSLTFTSRDHKFVSRPTRQRRQRIFRGAQIPLIPPYSRTNTTNLSRYGGL